MSDIDVVESTPNDDPMRREAKIIIQMNAHTPGRIGPVMDEFLSLLKEAAEALAQNNVTVEVLTPGWHDTFYGKESDQDDLPA